MVVLLCSDLQSHPEMPGKTLRMMISNMNINAVLRDIEGYFVSLGSRIGGGLYCEVFRLTSRSSSVPFWFYAFGCYRDFVGRNALHLPERSELDVRQCLCRASETQSILYYNQTRRMYGTSSDTKLS